MIREVPLFGLNRFQWPIFFSSLSLAFRSDAGTPCVGLTGGAGFDSDRMGGCGAFGLRFTCVVSGPSTGFTGLGRA